MTQEKPIIAPFILLNTPPCLLDFEDSSENNMALVGKCPCPNPCHCPCPCQCMCPCPRPR